MSSPRTINHYFFEETNNLHNEIIALHNFVLPMATAMWQFRDVISKEIRNEEPHSSDFLKKKYNTAPGTRGSTDLIYPFHTVSWGDQLQRIAEISLVNIISIFEIWCDEICMKLGFDDLSIKMQFPTNVTKTKGVCFAISEMTKTESLAVKSSIYPSLVSAKKYSIENLDNLLKCFRYFKELRNSFMHRGRRCDGKLYGAQSEFVPVASKGSLGMKFVPEYFTFQIGDPIQLSFHGVLGFTEVILKIVTTIDAELSRSIAAELEIVKRIKEIKKTPMKRSESVQRVLNTLGIQKVSMTDDFINFLRVNNVIV